MDVVSIIIPSYNQGKYLEECLDSIIVQSYEFWEAIVVDDGSTDNTAELMATLLKKDERIKFISKKNGGVSSARNEGIRQAGGKYILPVDGDDKIAQNLLEQSVAVFEQQKNVGLVFSQVQHFEASNALLDNVDYNFSQLLLNNQISCTAMYLKSDFKKTTGYDENMRHGVEDWEFWINLLSTIKEKAVIKLDFPGLYYRIKTDSRSVSFESNKSKITEIHNYVFQKHIRLYNEYYGDPIMVYSKMNYLERKIQPFLKLKAILRKLSFRK